MADARVVFLTMNYEEGARPGEEARFQFACPKEKDLDCGGCLIVGVASGRARGDGSGAPLWDWDGNRDAPTFSPSINCQDCWHGYIRNGRTVDCAGVDEPEPQ